MAPSPDSKDTQKEKGKEKSPPAPPSESDSPPSSPPTESPSKSDSSAPPPSNPSPPPPAKSPPPPKSPPSSPPPSPASSPPPPPSEDDSPSPSPPAKSSPSPPPASSKNPPPTPSPPPEEDSPTPSPPPSSESSSSSSSPSKSPPPSNSSPESKNSPSSSSPPSSSPSPPFSSSPSSPYPPPSPSPSSSSSFSPPPPISPSSSPPSPDSSPSPPADSSTPSWTMPKSPSNKPAPNLTVNSIVNSPNHPQEQAARIGIAFGIVAAVLIVGFILAIMFVHRRRKKRNHYNSMYMVPSAFGSSPDTGSSFTKPSPNNGGDFTHPSPDAAGIGNSKTWFSYEELATATDGFDSKHVIGAGGFGCVYKGFLQDGKEVAIKKLKDKSGQGDREFRAEVEIISRVHHRHLVSLVGYCIIDEQRLLVYDFVQNNTLYHHLHAANKPPMNWALRVRVACGSARGIAYLHEDCNPRIIHRDIKSANILLTNSFEAKVSDFGLAKLAQELESNTHVSTRVMGTFGYMAPEYATSGKLTEKSDVFSFGVVLLELITGRKPVDDSRPLGDESLVEWARPLMSEALDTQNFDQLADSRLEGDYDRGEMFRMIEAAAACVRHSASKRPRMSQVVRALDTMGDLSNGVRPGESEIMDSREQSVQIRMFQRMTFDSQDYSSENYNSQSSWTSRNTSGCASIQSGRWSGQT